MKIQIWKYFGFIEKTFLWIYCVNLVICHDKPYNKFILLPDCVSVQHGQK